MLLSLCLEVNIPLIRKSVDLALNFTIQQECIPVGCIPSTAVAISGGGVYLGAVCLPREGECLPGGVSAWGVCLGRGCLPKRVCLG